MAEVAVIGVVVHQLDVFPADSFEDTLDNGGFPGAASSADANN